MRTLDGSTGEGGGQILRTALFLSHLTGQPFRMERIRANRPQPGLKPQHLGILEALGALSGSLVRGATLGATAIEYHPESPKPGTFRLNVGTAGSIPLVLQTLVPVCLLAPGPVNLALRGGTDVRGGPTISWVARVLLPWLRPFARTVAIETHRHGFEPSGGGEIELKVEPRPDATGSRGLAAIVQSEGAHLTPGAWVSFHGSSIAHADLAARDVAGRQSRAAQARLRDQGYPEPRMENRIVPADSIGSSITLWVEDDGGLAMGADALGSPRVRAEDVGILAASRLVEELQAEATVDRHLADHLVPWVAMGLPGFRVPVVTGHLETNVWTTQQFLGPESVKLEGGKLQGGV